MLREFILVVRHWIKNYRDSFLQSIPVRVIRAARLTIPKTTRSDVNVVPAGGAMIAVGAVLFAVVEVITSFVMLGTTPVALRPVEKTTSNPGASEGSGPTGDTNMELMGFPLTKPGQQAPSARMNPLPSGMGVLSIMTMLTSNTSTVTTGRSWTVTVGIVGARASRSTGEDIEANDLIFVTIAGAAKAGMVS